MKFLKNKEIFFKSFSSKRLDPETGYLYFGVRHEVAQILVVAKQQPQILLCESTGRCVGSNSEVLSSRDNVASALALWVRGAREEVWST